MLSQPTRHGLMRTTHPLAAMASVDSSVAEQLQQQLDPTAAPGGGVMLPPDVIAAFLQQQRGSTEDDDDADAADSDTPLAAAGGTASKQQHAAQRRSGPRRALPRWLKRLMVMAAHIGLLTGGVAIGQAIHANYMVSEFSCNYTTSGRPR